MSEEKVWKAKSLLPGTQVHPNCSASIVIPARNEESSLPATLDSIRDQVDHRGRELGTDSYEILLLLNNCTDASLSIARAWHQLNSQVNLHVLERQFAPEIAHVGTARSLLMDTAWGRLQYSTQDVRGIFSTDSDTLPDPCWVTNTLRALTEGADAVGGAICLKQREFHELPEEVKTAYLLDRKYQRLVAELEDILDPQAGDPWPRHLEHFGGSLACTPEAYARAGGMPPISPLEDVAFVDALRQSGAKLRHDPSVIVYTSARLEGRATVGLSHQLREWHQMSVEGHEQRVISAASQTHRFRVLRLLRLFYNDPQKSCLQQMYPSWASRLYEGYRCSRSIPEFLFEVNCDLFIKETLNDECEGEIREVNRQLEVAIARLRSESKVPPRRTFTEPTLQGQSF